MKKNVCPTITLSNGVVMPQLGLGVWKSAEGNEVTNAVRWAIEAGYRLIDTAAIYQNEHGVGEGIKLAGIPREELFITSKVWNDDQGYHSTLAAFETTLEKLQLDYLDLYLIHWPKEKTMTDTWRALEELYEAGKIRAIGVSNFHKVHIDMLLQKAHITPMVNQIELHPLLSQEGLRKYCDDKGIAVEAWSPLGQGNLLGNETLEKIGEKYNKSVAQVILRWDIQNGIVTIPKSVKKARIHENFAVFDFELTAVEMEKINELNKNHRIGPDPENFDF